MHESFNRALEESYSDPEQLGKMYDRIHVTQYEKIIAKERNQSIKELKGKDIEKGIKQEFLKKGRDKRKK